jgi:hypothetical protein
MKVLKERIEVQVEWLLANLKVYWMVLVVGESTLQWPKNVVTNTIFWNYAAFNIHQATIKRGFYKLYSK